MKLGAKKILVLAAVMAMTAVSAMPAFAKTKLDTVSDLYWNEDDDDSDKITEAIWEEVEDAYRYEVYLYRDESKVAEIKTKDTSYNFRKKMTKEGDYTFKVRALAKDNDKNYSTGSWSEESDSVYITASRAEWNSGNATSSDDTTHGPGVAAGVGQTTNTADTGTGVVASPGNDTKPAGGWVKDDAGWWYKNADGTWPASAWFKDPADGHWYRFDANGYMLTGWFIDVDGKEYYCDPSGTPMGAMVTGEKEINGVTYQFDESGARIGA